ncbi:MAG: hypothetical protein JSW72_01175 [Candidatus Bathyarchaeota archaeon]|nr:MAG: hypothetical protein JSW72_01175 [Candidatus Bathyarchaeota archaeon]
MPPDPAAAVSLKKAKEEEQRYNWLEAAKSYVRALNFESKDPSFVAETWQNAGLCYVRASRQAENTEKFKKLTQAAVEAYENATEILAKEAGTTNKGRSIECKAIAAFLSSWLAADPLEKRELLDKCIASGTESQETLKKSRDESSYGKICPTLLECFLERFEIASTAEEMQHFVQKGLRCAVEAVETLTKLGKVNELAFVYSVASLLMWHGAHIDEKEEKRNELARKSLQYSEKALTLSEEAGDPYSKAMSRWAAALCTLLFTPKIESALKHAEEMLQQGTIIKDNYIKGIANYILAFVTWWAVLREADPEKQKQGYQKIIQYSQDAIVHLQVVAQDLETAEAYRFYIESYTSLASDVQTHREEKVALFEKAIKNGRKGFEYALRSGSVDAIGSVHHALSKALHSYSSLKTEKNDRTELLQEALKHRKELYKVIEKAYPSNDWMHGVSKNYEGMIKADIARLETDRDTKLSILRSAVSDIEEGVSHSRKWILSRSTPTQLSAVAGYEDTLGEMLNELHSLTKDNKILAKAAKAFEDSAQKFEKISLSARAAESYWKNARIQDRLGKYMQAAEVFESAVARYNDAANKISYFADFYLDYATYMKAWSEIERAKIAHSNEEYATATRHYEKTASLLKRAEPWSYLAPNFLAWSFLEQAEDLSRKERVTEAIKVFQKAAELFKRAQESFAEEVAKIEVPDEREKAVELDKASSRKQDYCVARLHVEQARVYDQEGNYGRSAAKYNNAANVLEKLIGRLDIEAERKEIAPVIFMCRAWNKMKTADERDLPELYKEASELFLQAKERSTNRRTSLLAEGNSALCKALEFGTKFEASRDKEDFSNVKKFLDSAANYYLKAGFEKASLWTNATEILFDAYNFMSNAEIEVDPEKRMKTYLVTERCLKQSAELYETAGYIGKRDEVSHILKRVKEKREFALSLGELLAAPSDASSTTLIAAPSLIVEEPVGVMKFKNELLQTNLIARKRELVAGEKLDLEIHLANLGKGTAFLTKLQGLIPEGFELVEKPEKCVVVDGVLEFRGRRIAALDTLEIRLALRAKTKGQFVFASKILYINEASEAKSHELESLVVNVKGTGIREWLRGPG